MLPYFQTSISQSRLEALICSPTFPGGGGEEDYGEDFEGEYEGDDDGAVAGPSGGGGGGGVESGGGGAGGATKGRHQVKSTVKGELGTGETSTPWRGHPSLCRRRSPSRMTKSAMY